VKAVLGVSIRKGVAPPATRVCVGITTGKVWKFYVKVERLGAKLLLCFDFKQSAILSQTFGHKWFSDVA